MTYKHYNVAVDEPLPFINGIERSLYLEMCYRADNRGIVRTPQSQLSTLTLFSPRTIATAFNTLQDKGLLLRLGHGRYQIVLSLETISSHSSGNGIRQELAQWLRGNNDCIIDGKLILREDSGLPEIVQEATTQELLKLNKRFKVVMGIKEDGSKEFGSYVEYIIQL